MSKTIKDIYISRFHLQIMMKTRKFRNHFRIEQNSWKSQKNGRRRKAPIVR